MKPSRRPSFSLRTFLIVVTLVAILIGFFGNRAYRDYLATQADVAIEASSAQVIRNEEKKIVRVLFRGANFDDKRLKELASHLRHLPTLDEVDFVQTGMTDDAIEFLLRLKHVDEIYLFETAMTPEGIAQLDRLMPGTAVKTEMPEKISSGMASMNIYTHAIVGLDWTPDGSLLATGSGDGIIRLWDLQSPEPVDQWKAHKNWTFAVAYSPDGDIMATGGGDNMIRIWDAQTSDLKFELSGHSDDVHAICFTRDGKGLISSGDDKAIRFWDLGSQQQTRTLYGHEAQIPSIAIGPKGRLLASASRDDTIRIWDIDSGETLAILSTDSWDVNSVAFDTSGNFLASGDQGGNVAVWNLNSFQQELSFVGHKGKVYSVEFDANNQLASCGDDGVRLTDLFARLDDQEKEVANSNRFAKSIADQAGPTVTSSAIDSKQTYVSNLAFRPQQDLLATTNADGEVHFIDTESRETVQVLRSMYGERGFDWASESVQN